MYSGSYPWRVPSGVATMTCTTPRTPRVCAAATAGTAAARRWLESLIRIARSLGPGCTAVLLRASETREQQSF
jgi:hypothetical protein